MPGFKINSLFAILALLFSLTASFIFAETYPVTNPKSAGVCILYYDSEFKKKLASDLVKEFNAKEIPVTVDDISNSTKYNPSSYGAVVLLSGMEKFNPLPLAPEYIKTNNYSSNIVYFVSYKLFANPYGSILDKNKIDAISSASTLTDKKVLEEAKNKIIAKVMKIIKL